MLSIIDFFTCSKKNNYFPVFVGTVTFLNHRVELRNRDVRQHVNKTFVQRPTYVGGGSMISWLIENEQY